MGKRSRRREASGSGVPSLGDAPVARYPDPEGNVLELRGALTPSSRRAYADVLHGGLHQEDAWQRAVEFLFERLAVSWTIAGLAIDSQRELLARYRIATAEERRFVRETLRAHVAEHFPELEAP